MPTGKSPMSLQSNLPDWSGRFDDNRFQGMVRELQEMIADCNDYETLMRIGTTLKNGLGGRALNKAKGLSNV